MSVELAMLDVGQGDCFVVLDQLAQEAVLIDCPANCSHVAASFLAARGFDRVRLAVVSHLHDDHYGGMETLLNGVDADRLWISVVADLTRANPKAKAFLAQVRKRCDPASIPRSLPHVGRKLTLTDIDLEVLGPDDQDILDSLATGNPNHSSAIIRVSFGTHRALVGGDAPPPRWERLANAGVDLRADVLAIPHHGGAFAAKPSRLESLLDLVQPSILLVSVGAFNRYRHPHMATLETAGKWARANGAQLVCTQLTARCVGSGSRDGATCAGTVSVFDDRGVLNLITERPEHATFVRTTPGCPGCVGDPVA